MMTYAQQLLEIEKQKEALLKESANESHQNYFCFINLEPIQILGRSNQRDIKYYLHALSFEIISINKEDKNQLYSLEFETKVEMNRAKDSKEKLKYSNSSSPDVKNINQHGLFFINNYDELDTKQQKDLLGKINSYYDKLQDPYDDIAIRRIQLKNVIGYIKKSNVSLEDFVKEIVQNVDSIIENNLSSMVFEKRRENWEEVEDTYHLTTEDKKALIKNIKEKMPEYIKMSLNIETDEGSYQQDWIKLRNQAIKHFKSKDNQS
jgi:hypothetical protein